MYGWTFATIADMTPLQQIAALDENDSGGKTVTFANEKQYARWLSERNKGN